MYATEPIFIMKTSILKFVAPEGTVRLSNMVIDAYKKQFSAILGFKAKGKRTFTEQAVAGTITGELANWFSLITDEKIKVEALNERGYIMEKTGRKLTNFQKYLKKMNIEETPNVLHSLIFEDNNTSEVYQNNPFKLVMYAEGKCTLSLVNSVAKTKIERVEPSTGEIHTYYKDRYFVDANGKNRKSYTIPAYYKRLIVQQQVEVQQFVEA